MPNCQRCNQEMTLREQRHQYARVMEGLTRAPEGVKVVAPLCGKCATIFMHEVGVRYREPGEGPFKKIR
jgi:hypothetical protein